MAGGGVVGGDGGCEGGGVMRVFGVSTLSRPFPPKGKETVSAS